MSDYYGWKNHETWNAWHWINGEIDYYAELIEKLDTQDAAEALKSDLLRSGQSLKFFAQSVFVNAVGEIDFWRIAEKLREEAEES
jgi:hypothetical protein